MRRVLTALALIPVVVYVVFWANFWIFLGVVATVALLCYHEYDAIVAHFGFGAPGKVGYAAGLLLLVWGGDASLPIVVLALLSLTLAMREEDLTKSLPRAALLFTGIVYIFGCWRCAIGSHDQNPHWLMYALLLNWAGDSGAYFVGRSFGRHKLASRVSPKKSWEGAVASVATSVLIAGAYLLRTVPGVPVVTAVALTAVANAAGQLGDLAESAIKRGAGVKDSGTMLPGHGGFLDRVDSTLFALPVVYAYLKLVA
ncbi:MAG TPA: phosphatidate cytidylyltransferase [Bryobacteraceae bacterium]|jgi:phosphatidate cytidylyltransferase|nr:phosphatidate cytidylyltransferase [Bryobacteraceae bacterium]